MQRTALAVAAVLLLLLFLRQRSARQEGIASPHRPVKGSLDERLSKEDRLQWYPPRDAHAKSSMGCHRSAVKKLVIGIITAPNNWNRRAWIRQHLRVTEASCRNIEVLFVLGSRNHMTRAQRGAIRFEMQMHDDIVFVPARDWVPHAVAEKSLAWWQYAARTYKSKWYCKTDDDSLMYLPRIEKDLEMMNAMGRSHYYYGVMTWRAWIPWHTEPDAGCGARGDDGPSLSGPSATLKKLLASRASSECSHALGPYPFADGSLQIISDDLLRSFVSTELTLNFSRSHLHRQIPPFWTHEDAGIGYLMFHEAVRQRLPLTYVVLSAWRHNKFWINWFPKHNPSLPTSHVVNTHKVVTSMMAQIAMDAYENTTYSADPIICGDCQTKWGWQGCHNSLYGRVPIDRFACCNKAVGTEASRSQML